VITHTTSHQIIGIAILIISYSSFYQSNAQDGRKLIPLPADSKTIRESDLEPLVKLIGNARIIATSEADHGMGEPLDFRNALIKLLVKKKVIDAVIIESGITESRLLYDYVLDNKPGNISDILYNGLSWQFYVLPQNEELVTWLKMYNSDPKNSHKVKLYGFDMPGSPTNHVVHRKMNTALISSLEYLKKVDPAGYLEFSNKLLLFDAYLHINFTNHTPAEKQYIDLSTAEREKLTLYTQQLIQYFEINEIVFTEKSSTEDYEWNYQSVLNLQHNINLANYVPTDYKIVSNEELKNSELLRKISRYRDRAMLDNIEWILKREANSKVLLFASTAHLLKAPVSVVLDSAQTYQRECVGNYLNHRYKDNYFLIANLVAKEDEKDRLENKFIDEQHASYYMKIPGDNIFLREESRQLNYQSKKMKLDITKAADIVLFNKRQTMVKFRGN
jgi:erythromycin esterase